MVGKDNKEVKKREYAWADSASDEIWRGGPCDSAKECMEEAVSLGDYKNGDTIAVGIIERYVPYVDANRLIEWMQEDAVDEVGEIADDWLADISKKELGDLHERLSSTTLDWLKQYNLMPTFYKVHPLAEPVVIKLGDGDGA
jgi:hypothetical protein